MAEINKIAKTKIAGLRLRVCWEEFKKIATIAKKSRTREKGVIKAFNN